MFTYQTPIKYYRLHYIHYHNDILINNPPSLIIRVYNAKLGGGLSDSMLRNAFYFILSLKFDRLIE